LILNLGYNLLSARHVSKYSIFIGLFNNNDISIMKKKEVKIYGSLDNGLEIVKFIGDYWRQKDYVPNIEPIDRLIKIDQ
jgi:hypothetical protein